jgi:hypothetical protein
MNFQLTLLQAGGQGGFNTGTLFMLGGMILVFYFL